MSAAQQPPDEKAPGEVWRGPVVFPYVDNDGMGATYTAIGRVIVVGYRVRTAKWDRDVWVLVYEDVAEAILAAYIRATIPGPLTVVRSVTVGAWYEVAEGRWRCLWSNGETAAFVWGDGKWCAYDASGNRIGWPIGEPAPPTGSADAGKAAAIAALRDCCDHENAK